MPNPKFRHSKARTRRVRAEWKKRIDHSTTILDCDNCGESVLSHHVCQSCGFYDGKKVVDIKSKDE